MSVSKCWKNWFHALRDSWMSRFGLEMIEFAGDSLIMCPNKTTKFSKTNLINNLRRFRNLVTILTSWWCMPTRWSANPKFILSNWLIFFKQMRHPLQPNDSSSSLRYFFYQGIRACWLLATRRFIFSNKWFIFFSRIVDPTYFQPEDLRFRNLSQPEDLRFLILFQAEGVESWMFSKKGLS